MRKNRYTAPFAALVLLLALSLNPTVANAQTAQEGQQLLKQGKLPQALQAAEQMIAARPKDPQARFLKGLVLMEMKNETEALTVFTALTEDYPELAEPYNNVAVIYAEQRQYDKAKDALEMAVRVNPGYATAHENLGDIYARLASLSYDKALQLDGANVSARAKLATLRSLNLSTNIGPPLAARD